MFRILIYQHIWRCWKQPAMNDLGLDTGDPYVCKNYHDLSFADTYILYQITDKFNSIFLKDSFVSNRLRQLGFRIIENNKKIKNYITNFAMGI